MIQQYITISASHIFLPFSSHFHNHPPIFPISLLCSLPLRGLRTPPASGSLLRSFTSLLPPAQRPQNSSRQRVPPQVIYFLAASRSETSGLLPLAGPSSGHYSQRSFGKPLVFLIHGLRPINTASVNFACRQSNLHLLFWHCSLPLRI